MALALATAPVSFAQRAQPARPERAQPAPPAQPAPQTTATDEEIETFATIYVDLLDTAAKLEAELKAAETEEEALEIRERVEIESVAKVAQRGWTPETFNTAGDPINREPVLTEKAVKAIQAKKAARCFAALDHAAAQVAQAGRSTQSNERRTAFCHEA